MNVSYNLLKFNLSKNHENFKEQVKIKDMNQINKSLKGVKLIYFFLTKK